MSRSSPENRVTRSVENSNTLEKGNTPPVTPPPVEQKPAPLEQDPNRTPEQVREALLAKEKDPAVRQIIEQQAIEFSNPAIAEELRQLQQKPAYQQATESDRTRQIQEHLARNTHRRRVERQLSETLPAVNQSSLARAMNQRTLEVNLPDGTKPVPPMVPAAQVEQADQTIRQAFEQEGKPLPPSAISVEQIYRSALEIPDEAKRTRVIERINNSLHIPEDQQQRLIDQLAVQNQRASTQLRIIGAITPQQARQIMAAKTNEEMQLAMSTVYQQIVVDNYDQGLNLKKDFHRIAELESVAAVEAQVRTEAAREVIRSSFGIPPDLLGNMETNGGITTCRYSPQNYGEVQLTLYPGGTYSLQTPGAENSPPYRHLLPATREEYQETVDDHFMVQLLRQYSFPEELLVTNRPMLLQRKRFFNFLLPSKTHDRSQDQRRLSDDLPYIENTLRILLGIPPGINRERSLRSDFNQQSRQHLRALGLVRGDNTFDLDRVQQLTATIYSKAAVFVGVPPRPPADWTPGQALAMFKV